MDVFNSRSPRFQAAVDRASTVEAHTGCAVRVHDLADGEALASCCARADAIVNATSVGMAPHEDDCLLSPALIPAGAWVADAVYNPRETKLLRMAQRQGNPTMPGIDMIIWQGAIAEEIWLDRRMDVDLIRKLLA